MSPRIVVVTGTSSGLGQEIARRLHADGYTVIGIARREVDAAAIGSRYIHYSFDLGLIDDIAGLVRRIVDEHGWPYGLVNCAAAGSDGVLPTMHTSEIERVIRVNLTAPIVLTKYLVRGMIDARAGRVVNIGSIVASTGYRGLAAYASTKAGLEGFTRSLARDLGRRNVTVNTVAPGFMTTEMTQGLGADALASVMRRSALGRLPEARTVAGMVSLLLGPDGDDITGTVLTVDAGNTA